MTLLIAVYVPAGIALAADSRLTATRTETVDEGDRTLEARTQLVLSDATNKLVELRTVRCAIGLYDNALLDGQPIDAHVRRFEEEQLTESDDVEATANKLHEYLRSTFPDASVGYNVAGYRIEERVSVPHLYAGHSKREISRINVRDDGNIAYGVSRSGDTDVANRLIRQDSLPPFDAMPLQDAVDYAVHLIRATVDTLRFEPRHPTVGGPIDVMTVTADGCTWVRQKRIGVAD
jgi:hypothetical protein